METVLVELCFEDFFNKENFKNMLFNIPRHIFLLRLNFNLSNEIKEDFEKQFKNHSLSKIKLKFFIYTISHFESISVLDMGISDIILYTHIIKKHNIRLVFNSDIKFYLPNYKPKYNELKKKLIEDHEILKKNYLLKNKNVGFLKNILMSNATFKNFKFILCCLFRNVKKELKSLDWNMNIFNSIVRLDKESIEQILKYYNHDCNILIKCNNIIEYIQKTDIKYTKELSQEIESKGIKNILPENELTELNFKHPVNVETELPYVSVGKKIELGKGFQINNFSYIKYPISIKFYLNYSSFEYLIPKEGAFEGINYEIELENCAKLIYGPDFFFTEPSTELNYYYKINTQYWKDFINQNIN